MLITIYKQYEINMATKKSYGRFILGFVTGFLGLLLTAVIILFISGFIQF